MAKKRDIGSLLGEIYKTNGTLTPSIVVNESRPETAPLHDLFEWDNDKAGEEYRLIQARKLIKSVEIVYNKKREPLVHVPSIKREEGEYKPLSIVVKSKDDFALAIEEALTRMGSAKRAVKALEEAASSKGDETLSKIAIAMKALETARGAVATIH